MTGRALLNRVYAHGVQHMDEQQRAQFDALLADPATAQADQQQRTLADLRAVGGEIG